MKRKEIRELGRPKKAASPFFVFITEQRKLFPNDDNEQYSVWQKRMTNKWASMSDNDKKKYVDDFTKHQQEYK